MQKKAIIATLCALILTMYGYSIGKDAFNCYNLKTVKILGNPSIAEDVLLNKKTSKNNKEARTTEQ